jgi:hypothetical protein
MAFFFKKFDKISYSFISDPSQKKQVTNILTAFFLRKVSAYKSFLFQKYSVRDDDSIESLADKIYGNPAHYWTFLVVNDIIDPFSEWAKDSYLLEKFVAKKYQVGRQFKKVDGTTATVPFSSGVGGIHHFININTGRVCDDVEDEYYREKYANDPKTIGKNIIPVTNLNHESDLDIERREISIVSKNFILDFEEDFSKMLSKGHST